MKKRSTSSVGLLFLALNPRCRLGGGRGPNKERRELLPVVGRLAGRWDERNRSRRCVHRPGVCRPTARRVGGGQPEAQAREARLPGRVDCLAALRQPTVERRRTAAGRPRYYKNVLYPKGTQLAEAVSFLQAHKRKVALVTINIGAGDLNHYDAQGNLVVCLFEPAGCAFEEARMQANLAAILAELRAAAGPNVPIVGMTYYNVFASIWFDDPSTALHRRACGRARRQRRVDVRGRRRARRRRRGRVPQRRVPAVGTARVCLDVVLLVRRHTTRTRLATASSPKPSSTCSRPAQAPGRGVNSAGPPLLEPGHEAWLQRGPSPSAGGSVHG